MYYAFWNVLFFCLLHAGACRVWIIGCFYIFGGTFIFFCEFSSDCFLVVMNVFVAFVVKVVHIDK